MDDIGQVRGDLEDKAGRYGRPDRPFLIAASVQTPFFQGDDTMPAALFGTTVMHFDTRTNETRESRTPDGLWMSPSGARYKRVSAVVVVPNVRPWHFTDREPVTWHNPWAALPLPDVLPWESRSVNLESGTLATRNAMRRAHEVFDLPEGWPGPEDALPRDA